MSAEDDFYALVSADAGVKAEVDERIYPDALPEKCPYPAVAYSRSATEPDRLLDGSVAETRVELSVGCWAETRSAADAAAAAIAAALADTDFDAVDQVAGLDPEVGLYVATLKVETYI